MDKADLPGQLCAFLSEVLRTEAMYEPGRYDVIHSHYWLSGQVGWLAKERWGVPLVHTMHTMAKVKNRLLADGRQARAAGPRGRRGAGRGDRRPAGGQHRRRGARAHRAVRRRPSSGSPWSTPVSTSPSSSPLHSTRPGAGSACRMDAYLLLFVGRIQPLKAPDVLLRAASRMLIDDPSLRGRLVVACVGGPSGNGLARPSLLTELAAELGIADVIRLRPARAAAGARRLVPRGRRDRGALAQRVLRPGRIRVTGLRHPGRRRRRGRAAHRGPRRRLRPARGRSRPARLGQGAEPLRHRAAPPRRPVGRRPRARRRLRLAGHRLPASWRSTPRRSPTCTGSPWRSTHRLYGMRAVVEAALHRRGASPLTSRGRERSWSNCPGSTSSPPWSG